MNDRWVLQTVNSPNGPSSTAATATRGSSRSQERAARAREPHRHAGPQRRQPDHPPGDHRVAGQQRDAVGGRARLLVAGRGHPGAARRAGQRGDELVLGRAHRLGGDGGEVRAQRPRLVAVDLLQPEHVGVQALHGGGQPVDVDPAVVRASARAGC